MTSSLPTVLFKSMHWISYRMTTLHSSWILGRVANTVLLCTSWHHDFRLSCFEPCLKIQMLFECWAVHMAIDNEVTTTWAPFPFRGVAVWRSNNKTFTKFWSLSALPHDVRFMVWRKHSKHPDLDHTGASYLPALSFCNLREKSREKTVFFEYLAFIRYYGPSFKSGPWNLSENLLRSRI